MVPAAAGSKPDPRIVATPVSPVKASSLLYHLGILDTWSHIIHGLIHGFDIGIPTSPTSTYISPNHLSSKLDPGFISSYIAAEEAAGRYSPSFLPDELEALIGPFRTSPIGLVPKPNSSKLRMIQDLSFPRNNPSIPSVNSLIDPESFPTSWGSFVHASDMILSLPHGSLLATFDISAAYRLTPIRPSQQNWVCVSWEGRVWVDRAVMFGMSSSAGVFGAVADMLVAIYVAAGFGPIYIGVPWSVEKLRPLAVVQRYIGFDWHADEKAVSFPPEKLQKLLSLIEAWLLPNAKFTCKESSSLHGNQICLPSSPPISTTLSPSLVEEHQVLAPAPSPQTSSQECLSYRRWLVG